jgi:hypothetical protein
MSRKLNPFNSILLKFYPTLLDASSTNVLLEKELPAVRIIRLERNISSTRVKT